MELGVGGSTVSGTQSACRKCHTQHGAGPQVSVRHSIEAEELGAGRLQQTVTFAADPEEFPPSAGPLIPSCGCFEHSVGPAARVSMGSALVGPGEGGRAFELPWPGQEGMPLQVG